MHTMHVLASLQVFNYRAPLVAIASNGCCRCVSVWHKTIDHFSNLSKSKKVWTFSAVQKGQCRWPNGLTKKSLFLSGNDTGCFKRSAQTTSPAKSDFKAFKFFASRTECLKLNEANINHKKKGFEIEGAWRFICKSFISYQTSKFTVHVRGPEIM